MDGKNRKDAGNISKEVNKSHSEQFSGLNKKSRDTVWGTDSTLILSKNMQFVLLKEASFTEGRRWKVES